MYRRRLAILLSLLVFLFAASRANAQRNLTDIPSPDPEEERKTFQVAEGFEVNLYAADPLLAKPIQMNFDPAGRLWVASSETYPQIAPGQKANDKVIILEDKDQDGRAETTRVFADGLLIPTGIEPGDGGCYVGASTELLHLRDSDNDGKADQRRVVLSGFGTEDTHHIIHTLRWGPDGCLYFCQSIYIHSHVETPWGPRRLNGGGVWQYRPDTEKLEVYCKGFINPWGFQFDRYGQSFVTDGAGGEGINYAFPGAVFPTSPGARRVLHGMNPGSPKFCGLEILSGRQLPDDWQGDIITNDFRGHRVCRFKLTEDGSGYSSREMPELIKTSHVAFRPVDVKMGPDGAIYIADWYNPIIQHGEVDFRDPRRDHTHGRIWRVTRKDRPVLKHPQLVDATVDDLIEQQKSPEMWTRQQARRELKHREREEVLTKLQTATHAILTQHPKISDEAIDIMAAEQTVSGSTSIMALMLTQSSDHRVRAAAVRAMGNYYVTLAMLLDFGLQELSNQKLSKFVGKYKKAIESFHALADPHPRVRLEGICTQSAVKKPQDIVDSLYVTDMPMDENIDFALWQLLTNTREIWEQQIQSSDLEIKPEHFFYLAKISESPKIASALASKFLPGKLTSDQQVEVGEVVGRYGDPAAVAMLLAKILPLASAEPEIAASVLLRLVGESRSRKLIPVGDISGLSSALSSTNENLVVAATTAISGWRIESARTKLVEIAQAEKTPKAVRLAALDALADFPGPGTTETLRTVANGEFDIESRTRAAAALVRVDPTLAAMTSVKLLSAADEQLDPAPIVTAFIEQKDGAAALAKSLQNVKLAPDVAKRALRAANSSAKPDATLVAALRTAGGMSGQPLQLTAEQMQSLVRDVSEKGDAARGEMIFRRKDTACFKCHAIGGAGGQVGPDLTSLGGSAQVDYLVESMLEPSKKIKENYHSLVVQTDDGRVLTGVLVRQSDRDLILRNAEDQEITIPLKNIEDKANGLSLMPVGLADNLPRNELIDVVRFMSELGKVGGKYTLSKSRIIRRWQVMENTPAASEKMRRDRLAVAATNDAAFTWSPAYSTVAGELPLDDLPKFGSKWQGVITMPSVTILRSELNVTTPGRSLLALNSPIGVSLWIDGRAVDTAAEIALDLSTGRHRLTWAIDREKRTEPLRVEVRDVADSPANVQVVGGK